MTLILVPVHFLVGHFTGSSVHLTADDRLDSLFFALLIEIHNAEHGSVVGNGKTVHSQLLGTCYRFLDRGGSVQQAVFRMKMEMCKSHRTLLSLFTYSTFYHKFLFLKSFMSGKIPSLTVG